jgi:hypothetical protein
VIALTTTLEDLRKVDLMRVERDRMPDGGEAPATMLWIRASGLAIELSLDEAAWLKSAIDRALAAAPGVPDEARGTVFEIERGERCRRCGQFYEPGPDYPPHEPCAGAGGAP